MTASFCVQEGTTHTKAMHIKATHIKAMHTKAMHTKAMYTKAMHIKAMHAKAIHTRQPGKPPYGTVRTPRPCCCTPQKEQQGFQNRH